MKDPTEACIDAQGGGFELPYASNVQCKLSVFQKKGCAQDSFIVELKYDVAFYYDDTGRPRFCTNVVFASMRMNCPWR